MSEKSKNILVRTLTIIPFFIIWCLILWLFLHLHSEGVLSVIPDAFGKGIFYGWCIFGGIAFLSIVYLRIFIKKILLIKIFAYFLTIVFVVSGIALINAGDKKFSAFNSDLWKEYPAQRITMYFDLEEKNILEGVSEKEVVEILGAPDLIFTSEDTSSDYDYIYSAGHGNTVEISIKNGIAAYTGYTE